MSKTKPTNVELNLTDYAILSDLADAAYDFCLVPLTDRVDRLRYLLVPDACDGKLPNPEPSATADTRLIVEAREHGGGDWDQHALVRLAAEIQCIVSSK